MLIYAIILLAVITRFIPHMPNLAPITALAIFSGANLGWKKSVALTLAVRFVSDIFLGFFSWPLMVAVYASHLVGVLFGMWIKNSPRPSFWKREGKDAVSPSFSKEGAGGVNFHRWTKIIGSSLLSSVIFFLVTNFAFLYGNYPHNISGIILAYANGLPFFRGTLLGDLGYTAALFGGYEFAKWLAAQKARFLIPNS
jgi:hypothetical protein